MDKGDLKIAGNGHIQAGIYNEIKIMGNARSDGAIEADVIKVMGNANFEGDIKVQTLVVNGNTTIPGSIKAKEMKVNGQLEVEGNCEAERLTVNGGTKVKGNLKCEELVVKGGLKLTQAYSGKTMKIYGDLESPADISCEEATIDGKVNCDGLFNAEHIVFHASANSHCKEIGATTVEVVKPFYHFLWLSYFKKARLTCEVIEADEMKLENVEAQVIRGKNIELLSNCEIDRLEFSEDYRKDPDSVVKEVIKLD